MVILLGQVGAWTEGGGGGEGKLMIIPSFRRTQDTIPALSHTPRPNLQHIRGEVLTPCLGGPNSGMTVEFALVHDGGQSTATSLR